MRNIFRIDIQPGRIFGLDILRASAILLVLINHAKFYVPLNLKIYHAYFDFDGVTIFFVLSGFLIGGILIGLLEKNPSSKELLFGFWVRRWCRTLPNYFLILTSLVVLNLLFNGYFPLHSVSGYFLFSQNLFTPHPGFFPEAWSLSVEEWFYLLIPFCIFVVLRISGTKPQNAILITAIAILASITLFRYYRYSVTGPKNIADWDVHFRKQVFTRLDSLMFGVMGAYIKYYHGKFWDRHKIKFFTGGLILLVGARILYFSPLVKAAGWYNCVFSFSVTSLATLMLLPWLNSLKTGKGLLYRGITVISLTSYSMYLINHSIVQKFIINKIPWQQLTTDYDLIRVLNYAAYWILTVSGSILIYKYFEMPATNLRDKKFLKSIPFSLLKRSNSGFTENGVKQQ